jgi:hypothetical protein
MPTIQTSGSPLRLSVSELAIWRQSRCIADEKRVPRDQSGGSLPPDID